MSLPMKWYSFGAGVLAPERVEVQFGTPRAEVLEAGHVADRRVQPDVEVLAGSVGNLEAEVRRVTRDVPLLEAAVQPFGELVGHRLLKGAAAGPLLEHGLEVRQLEEVVQRFLEHRGGAGDRRFRVLQFGRGVGRAAGLAVVAVLVGGAALRAGALDEAVGEEHLLFRVEVLGHRAGVDVPGVAQFQVDRAGQLRGSLPSGSSGSCRSPPGSRRSRPCARRARRRSVARR